MKQDIECTAEFGWHFRSLDVTNPNNVRFEHRDEKQHNRCCVPLFESPPKLSYQVRLAKYEMIELSSGFSIIHKETSLVEERERFRPLEGRLHVFAESDESNEADRKGIGPITYIPADGDLNRTDTYFVEVLLPKVTVDELLAAARMGCRPSHIGIKVEGMDYGWAPDGSVKKWDNKAFPELDVVSVDFTFSERPTLSDEASSPTRSQVNELSEKLERLAIAIYNGFRSLIWAVILIGVLMLILRILR